MNIETEYWRKGRPGYDDPKRFDWEAVTDQYDEGDPVGFGATEAEAIADLREKLEEREP